MNLTDGAILRNGVKMPWQGFGVFRIKDGDEAVNSVKEALKVGYRHIDTATIYRNQKGVGQGIKESGVPREEIFITGKVWNTDQGYESTIKAFESSLNELGLEYLDLYLIHWPKPLGKDDCWKELNKETWRAMEHLYNEGKVRAIGVSNFHINHLEPLMETAEVMPMVNQIEYHPQFAQSELVGFCKEHNIQVEAWGPLMQGKIFDFQLMKDIAEKYNKTIAQIVLRWHLQTGVVAVPKSINPERIKSNSEIFDFELNNEDMKLIAGFNKEERIGPHPDSITF